MKIIVTKDFERSLKKFPSDARKLYQTQRQRFQTDWRDPRLHAKKMHGLPGVFSFRVTRRYRALFYFTKEKREAVFFEIGHRKDVY